MKNFFKKSKGWFQKTFSFLFFKVKVSGEALKKGKTHADNTFHVDTRNAGYGGLSLSVEGPSKVCF